MAAITNIFEGMIFRFIDRRSKSSNDHKLNHNNLYILPTVRGWLFIGLTAIIWLLGTNYQNNLILGLGFWLISLFVLSILHTYGNLVGLSLRFKGAPAVFAGEEVFFHFNISNSKKLWCDNIELRWQYSAFESCRVCLSAKGEAVAKVPMHGDERGVLHPGRMLLQSYYPLGLFRCWTWLRWDARAIIYPQPLKCDLADSSVTDDQGDGEHPMRGGEDFSSLKSYQPGDPPKHIAWKSYARGRGLYTKEFSQNLSRERWLDFTGMPFADVEQRLSGLCYWALEYHREDENYGLLMPGTQIEPDRGDGHRQAVLEALALFDKCV
ncbi:MAG: DUF58 domain-containing protein [Alteromonadaceae bacterium]|nr:MAG: DUF58 domain-containing protein [Alteromonadaceae bacterium]